MAADTTLTATTVTFGSDVGLGVRQLSVVGNAAFSASGTLAVAASGASGGDYGQVAVSGSVSLGGADLDLSVSYAARPGDALTIINDPSGVVSGTSPGWPTGRR